MRNKNPAMMASVVSFLVLMSVDSAASEAMGRLVQIEGTAMISQGDRYLPGSEGTFLKEGDRLFALEGSEAILLFADACRYRLGDDRVLDVGPQSPCALGLGGEYRPGLVAATIDAADEQADVLREVQSQIGRSSTVVPLLPSGGPSGRSLGVRVGAAGGPSTGAAGAGLVGGGTLGGTGSIVATSTLVAAGLGTAGLAGLVAAIENSTGGGGGDTPNPPLSQ